MSVESAVPTVTAAGLLSSVHPSKCFPSVFVACGAAAARPLLSTLNTATEYWSPRSRQQSSQPDLGHKLICTSAHHLHTWIQLKPGNCSCCCGVGVRSTICSGVMKAREAAWLWSPLHLPVIRPPVHRVIKPVLENHEVSK